MDKLPAETTRDIDPSEDSLHFIVNDLEELHQVMIRTPYQELQLTKQFLKSPLHSFDIIATSTSDAFDFTTRVRYPSNEAAPMANDVIASMTAKDTITEGIPEVGGNRMVQGPNGTLMVLSSSPGTGTIWISTGEVLNDWEDDTADGVQQRLLPSPELTLENIEKAIEDYLIVLDGVISTAYAMAGEPLPAMEIVISPDRLVVRNLKRTQAMGQIAIAQRASMQPEALTASIPDVTFDSIGGQDEAKRELQGLVGAIKSPESYERWGATSPKGILLFGPPGTGKTLFAKALANEAAAQFIHVSSADIGSHLYGVSEQNLQKIFNFAVESGEKTIIFFDELDTIIPPRDDSHEATQRITGVLLQNIDGMSSTDNVTILASTNRKDAVDSAMLRPGRLDRHIEISLPTADERQQIFGVHIAKAERTAGRILFNEIDTAALAGKTENCSGADIAEIVRRTLESKARQESDGLHPGPVIMDDITIKIETYEHVKKAKNKFGF